MILLDSNNKRLIFEGEDKSGKTTLSYLLYEYMIKKYKGRPIYYSSEPINDKNSIQDSSRKIIRDMIKYNKNISEETRNCLFFLDREILYNTMNKFKFPYIFISDRSFLSNLCIQNAFEVNTFENLFHQNIDLIKRYNIPTNVIFYIKRDKSLYDLENSNDDVLKKNLLHHRKKINEMYEKLLGKKELLNHDIFINTKIFTINNNGPIAETLSKILSYF